MGARTAEVLNVRFRYRLVGYAIAESGSVAAVSVQRTQGPLFA